jgi:hypothetical protein
VLNNHKKKIIFLYPCLKIFLGHGNSGVFRVTITRKVVVYTPAMRSEKLKLFPLSPSLLCGHLYLPTIKSGLPKEGEETTSFRKTITGGNPKRSGLGLRIFNQSGDVVEFVKPRPPLAGTPSGVYWWFASSTRAGTWWSSLSPDHRWREPQAECARASHLQPERGRGGVC